jgi:deoxycytidylate deaminase
MIDPDSCVSGYLKIARKMAIQSTGMFKLGSVVAKSGRFLARGMNYYDKYNPIARAYFKFPTVHAEVDALNKLSPENIRGATIYVFRIRKDGMPAMSRPCYRCMNTMRALGIRKVIYSVEEYPYYVEERV